MDRRIKYTKKVIKDTLITLLEKKDINKITVSEICNIADINRATFYRYYLDVYDLLEKIETELVDELKKASKFEDNHTVSTFSRDLLAVLVQNKQLVKVLFNTKNNISFLTDILEIAYQKCKERWNEDMPNVSNIDIEYACVFIFNGALGVVNCWVKNDFDKDVNEIATLIEKLSYFGTKKFIYKK